MQRSDWPGVRSLAQKPRCGIRHGWVFPAVAIPDDLALLLILSFSGLALSLWLLAKQLVLGML